MLPPSETEGGGKRKREEEEDPEEEEEEDEEEEEEEEEEEKEDSDKDYSALSSYGANEALSKINWPTDVSKTNFRSFMSTVGSSQVCPKTHSHFTIHPLPGAPPSGEKQLMLTPPPPRRGPW